MLLVSAELDEVLELSDRIGVMYRGRLVDVVDGRTASKEAIGLLMATGGRAEGAGERGEVRVSTIDRLLSRSLRGQLALTGGAVLLALVVGAILMTLTSPIITGSLDPWLWSEAYLALVEGALLSSNGLIDTLVRATPYILAGLSVGLCFKAGLFNIGAQGQFLMGALGAVAAGIVLADAAPVVAIPLAMLAGVAAGAFYGFIPGWLKAFTGAHEVVVTIMLNFVALQIVSWAVSGPLRAAGATFARTPSVGAGGIPILVGSPGTSCMPASWWRWRPCPSCGGSCTARPSASRSARSAPTRTRRATPACARA